MPALRIVDAALWDSVRQQQIGCALANNGGETQGALERNASPQVRAERSSPMCRLRRRLHGDGQGPLRLRRARQIRNVRQRQYDHSDRPGAGACWTRCATR